MKLFLARHGETVDNVAQVYAGRTDSALTVHGAIQARRLGSHLAETKPIFTNIFSSDLQRASKTAEAVLVAQQQVHGALATESIITLEILQEKDFGPLEQRSYKPTAHTTSASARMQDGNEEISVAETREDVTLRSNKFLDEHIIPIVQNSTPKNEAIVLVVSHGLLLSSLWKALLGRFRENNVTFDSCQSSRAVSQTNLEHLGSWSNTGYLELWIYKLPIYLRTPRKPQREYGTEAEARHSCILADCTLEIKAINQTEHLRGIKRTGGGVGSSRYDPDQSTIDSFFKRRRRSE